MTCANAVFVVVDPGRPDVVTGPTTQVVESPVASGSVNVHDAVLTSAPKFTGSENARDRIFDVVMARFDVLAPYKEALKNIAAARPFDMALVRRAMAKEPAASPALPAISHASRRPI